jgi:hypothetical protein
VDCPAVSEPGCAHSHGMSIKIKSSGGAVVPQLDESNNQVYICRSCMLGWLQSQGIAEVFGDTPPLLCRLCLHDREKKKWEFEFENGICEARKAWCEASSLSLSRCLVWRATSGSARVSLSVIVREPSCLPSEEEDSILSWQAFLRALLVELLSLHPQRWIQDLASAVITRAGVVS